MREVAPPCPATNPANRDRSGQDRRCLTATGSASPSPRWRASEASTSGSTASGRNGARLVWRCRARRARAPSAPSGSPPGGTRRRTAAPTCRAARARTGTPPAGRPATAPASIPAPPGRAPGSASTGRSSAPSPGRARAARRAGARGLRPGRGTPRRPPVRRRGRPRPPRGPAGSPSARGPRAGSCATTGSGRRCPAPRTGRPRTRGRASRSTVDVGREEERVRPAPDPVVPEPVRLPQPLDQLPHPRVLLVVGRDLLRGDGLVQTLGRLFQEHRDEVPEPLLAQVAEEVQHRPRVE